ncbi:MAG: DUF1707 domain-containing protein [Thermoleophilaceae bacterium]|nr:DUF1707 domain-containing protein [Thermoleophilaceae bacterium]
MSAPDLLASDAERDAAAERLRRAGGEGRLAPEELEERLGVALSARTRGELDAVVGDLPATRRGRRRSARRPDLPVYLAVSLLLVAIWALTGMGYFWPVWPILGWGISFVMPHGVRACRRGHRLHA